MGVVHEAEDLKIGRHVALKSFLTNLSRLAVLQEISRR